MPPSSVPRALIIALMIEAVNSSEMSVSFYQTTWRNIPEDSHLRICQRENLKSHLNSFIWVRA
jgi:hypothetical protein